MHKKNPKIFILEDFTPHQSGAGFTLVEIMVSLVLISLTLVGLMNLFLGGRRWMSHRRYQMTGGELGKVFLDPLQMDVTMKERSSGAQNGWGQTSNCLTNFPGGCPGFQDIDGTRFTPTYNINNVENAIVPGCVEPSAGWPLGTCLKRAVLQIQWLESAS